MSDLKLGDTVTFDLSDRRWWVRLWCWVRRRELPVKRKAFVVTYMANGGLDIQPAIVASLEPKGAGNLTQLAKR